MTPALASASANTDSIKGLAQSIAKPAYKRLLTAEPALRRAVPVLIIAFLVTMGVGAGVQVHDHRRQAIGAIVGDIAMIADLLNARLDQAAAATKNDSVRLAQELLDRALPQHAADGGRDILLTDLDGIVIAAAPRRMVGTALLDILGPAQPLTTFGASAGVLETPLADGTDAFARRTPSTTRCAAASTPPSIADAAACGTGISRAAASSGPIPCSRSSGSSRATISSP